MNRRLFRFGLWMAPFVFALVFLQCGEDETDAQEISTELADRLTAALQFEGSEIVDEMPPPPGIRDEEPQIASFDAPSIVKVGEPFDVTLTTSWPNPEEIDMAVVWVKGASRHIWVNKDIYPVGASVTADINTLLANDPELIGKTFTVSIAFQIHMKTSGDYVDWVFTIEE